MRSTNIPVVGDRDYVDSISVLAKKHKTTMAALVRQALDKCYGDELNAIAGFFATSGVASTQHCFDKQNTNEGGDHAA